MIEGLPTKIMEFEAFGIDCFGFEGKKVSRKRFFEVKTDAFEGKILNISVRIKIFFE